MAMARDAACHAKALPMPSRMRLMLLVPGLLLAISAGCSRPAKPSAEIRGNVDEFATRVAQLGGNASVRADFTATGITDEDLAGLVFPDTVTEICLSRTKVTDEGLVHLKKVRNLKRLELAQTRISDAGVAHLKELPNLVHLDLHGSLVSGPVEKELDQQVRQRRIAQTLPSPK
jgi:hypothetical protein